ncbi:unnamed protein product [Symbiodinium sp. CCMP2456]|nr:unnamed protein product [Symbiodinium sp. CCMP2456]
MSLLFALFPMTGRIYVLALDCYCGMQGPAQLMELDEERLDLQRQLEREGRRRSSLSLRLDEAQQDAEGSGGKLAAALAARQAAESRLSAAEASLRALEASLAHAEVAAADSGSQSAAAAGLKVRLRDATELTEQLRSELAAESDGRSRMEGQLQQHRESVAALQQELETQRRVAAKTEGQLTETARTATKGVEEAAELRLTLQQEESRAVTLQAAQDSLESRLAAESRRRSQEQEVISHLKMELSSAASAKQQVEAAEASLESTLAAASRSRSLQEDLISNLRAELASASPAKRRLEVSEEAQEELSVEFAAALADARSLEEEQKSEIAELHSELLAALQQRRAALQASERAQAARLRQKEQAVLVQAQALKLRAQSELRGEALSATVESELEERGALVREQHAELFLEIRTLHGMVAQRDGELSESQKEFAEMKTALASFQSEARSSEKTAASERECCEMLLHQLEEITLQPVLRFHQRTQRPVEAGSGAAQPSLDNHEAPPEADLRRLRFQRGFSKLLEEAQPFDDEAAVSGPVVHLNDEHAGIPTVPFQTAEGFLDGDQARMQVLDPGIQAAQQGVSVEEQTAEKVTEMCEDTARDSALAGPSTVELEVGMQIGAQGADIAAELPRSSASVEPGLAVEAGGQDPIPGFQTPRSTMSSARGGVSSLRSGAFDTNNMVATESAAKFSTGGCPRWWYFCDNLEAIQAEVQRQMGSLLSRLTEVENDNAQLQLELKMVMFESEIKVQELEDGFLQLYLEYQSPECPSPRTKAVGTSGASCGKGLQESLQRGLTQMKGRSDQRRSRSRPPAFLTMVLVSLNLADQGEMAWE